MNASYAVNFLRGNSWRTYSHARDGDIDMHQRPSRVRFIPPAEKRRGGRQSQRLFDLLIKPRIRRSGLHAELPEGLDFVRKAPLDETALVIGQIGLQQFLVARDVRLVRPP